MGGRGESAALYTTHVVNSDLTSHIPAQRRMGRGGEVGTWREAGCISLEGWGTKKVGHIAAGNLEGLCNVNLWKPESASCPSGIVSLSFLLVCTPRTFPWSPITVTQVQMQSQL